MIRNVLLSSVLILSHIGAAQAADAPPPIAENKEIHAGFIPLGIADRLRDVCPEIEPAHFRAWMAILNLRNLARDQGYTDADIRGLRKNLEARAALKAEITEILKALGAPADHVASHCKIARQEIAAGSDAGRLIRVVEYTKDDSR
jgi:hypothetical protein